MTALLASLSLAPSLDEIRGSLWQCVPCGTEQGVSGLDKELVKYGAWQNATWPGVRCKTCGELMAFASRPVPYTKREARAMQQDEDSQRLDARTTPRQRKARREARAASPVVVGDPQPGDRLLPFTKSDWFSRPLRDIPPHELRKWAKWSKTRESLRKDLLAVLSEKETDTDMESLSPALADHPDGLVF